MISVLASALTLCCPALLADPHPLEGRWHNTFPWHIEVENGVVKPVMETGELKMEARGNWLIATLVTNPTTAFSPTRPIRLAAPLGSPEPVFVMRDPVTMKMSGTERQPRP